MATVQHETKCGSSKPWAFYKLHAQGSWLCFQATDFGFYSERNVRPQRVFLRGVTQSDQF